MDSRPPSGRAATVDGLRGLSALWVILYDIWRYNHGPDLGWLTPVFANGHLGVEVFMVLSGFCLFFPLAGGRPLAPGTWTLFFKRRLQRIVPPYYAAIAYAIALGALTSWVMASRPGGVGATPAWQPPTRWELASHLSLVHNLFPDVRAAINPSFWSLSLEAQYYVVFPLVAIALLRWRAWGVAAVLAVCALARFAGLALYDADPMAPLFWPFTSILGRLSIFVMGMLSAWTLRSGVVSRHAGWFGGGLLLAVVGALALGTTAYQWTVGVWPWSDLLVGVAAAGMILHAGRAGSWAGRLLASPVLAGIGTISYSFYLINGPTCFLVNVLVARWASESLLAGDVGRMVLTTAVGVPLSLLLATGFYRLVERPFMPRARGSERAPGSPSALPA